MNAKEEMSKYTSLARIHIKSNINIQKYLNSGSEVLRMANVYRDENDVCSAYFLYMKYITLFLEDLRQHPEYGSLSKVQKAEIKRNIKDCFAKAEILKEPTLEIFKIKQQQREDRKKTEPSISDENELPGNSEIEHYSGLRKIIVPKTLTRKFEQIADKNTRNNIETCGLLTGTLNRNRLTITVLIIPEQRGSSDDCIAEDDLATFNVIDQKGLLSFGWIHTHPTQQAFLSSVDLHSQFGYQAMLPEALAIVCAPKDSNKIFRLTDIGLDIIGKCTKLGFHQHSGSPLFEIADHATIEDVPCEVIDLRK